MNNFIDWLLFALVTFTVYWIVKVETPCTLEEVDIVVVESNSADEPVVVVNAPPALLHLLQLLQPSKGTILPDMHHLKHALKYAQSMETSPLKDYITLNIRKAIKYDGNTAAVLQYYQVVCSVLTSACQDALIGSVDAFLTTLSELMETLEDDQDYVAWEYKLRAAKITRHDIRWQAMFKDKQVKLAFKGLEAMLDHIVKIGEPVEDVVVQDMLNKLKQVKVVLTPPPSPQQPPSVPPTTSSLSTVKNRMRSLSTSVNWPQITA